jgi:branched-chain amino acid transport system permease protein
MTSISSAEVADFTPARTPLRTRSRARIAFAIAALAAFAGVPLVANDYWLNAILVPFLILSLAGLGLNLLMGYAGQASLGTGGFMSVGAYATYNLLLRLPELPLPVSLILGGVVAGLVGLAAGLLSLRIKGFYLVASTLATQFFLEWLFNQYGWFSNYSTSSSISAPRLAIFGHDLSGPVGCYLLTLSTVTILTAVAVRLVQSQTGRTWMAIRDMDTAAAVIGIPVASGKLKAFFVSSFVIGIAGALWAFAYLGTVDARSFNLDRSFEVMFIIILGGMGSIVGNYLGAAFMILLPILLDHVVSGSLGGAIDAGQLENFQKALFGGLIIWFLIKEPNGLAALLSRCRQWLARRAAP